MKFKSIALALVALVTFGCAGNRKPDVVIAQTGTTILAAVTELQKGITQMTDAKLLPVPTAQKLTGYLETVYSKSGSLSDALKAYHAATTPLDKQSKAALIQALLTQLNGPLAEMLGVSVPPGVVASLSKLVGNVMAVVGAVQAEVARGLGASDPLPSGPLAVAH